MGIVLQFKVVSLVAAEAYAGFPVARGTLHVAQAVIHRLFGWRRGAIEAEKDDLIALNSSVPLLLPDTYIPSLNTVEERGGIEPIAVLGNRLALHANTKAKRNISKQYVEDVALNRVSVSNFRAKWARTAKGRFRFANECVDTELNKDAVYRFIVAELRKINMPFSHISLHASEIVELAFTPDTEFVVRHSRRQVKQRARMEYYNERKALNTIRK